MERRLGLRARSNVVVVSHNNAIAVWQGHRIAIRCTSARSWIKRHDAPNPHMIFTPEPDFCVPPPAPQRRDAAPRHGAATDLTAACRTYAAVDNQFA